MGLGAGPIGGAHKGQRSLTADTLVHRDLERHPPARVLGATDRPDHALFSHQIAGQLEPPSELGAAG